MAARAVLSLILWIYIFDHSVVLFYIGFRSHSQGNSFLAELNLVSASVCGFNLLLKACGFSTMLCSVF